MASTNETLLFGWRRPSHDNGAEISHYVVQLSQQLKMVSNETLPVLPSERQNYIFIFVGLEPGECYAFQDSLILKDIHIKLDKADDTQKKLFQKRREKNGRSIEKIYKRELKRREENKNGRKANYLHFRNTPTRIYPR
ncbi:hypothetical protein CEXT_91581 [Caerostris extrusa]|uniref:Uncharacterized protein n=1 Tax=Caerostris extrusa TaxID=172846 RepID=A0AAV4RX82_CAEEX|nr:hypothetical protein CEXT_91581 [Caerostris extrusa]